jgi:transposase
VRYNLQQEGLSVGGYRMKIFKEYRRDQNFLLPPSLDEFIPEDHEVRVISEVVDILDLSPLLSRYEGGGASAYHPAAGFYLFAI